MDYNAAACTFLVTQLVLGTITEKDPFVHLPCFILYGRIFQLIFNVWCGAYMVAEELSFSELECDFLFRWFLLGGVLDDEEIQDILYFALHFCATTSSVPESAWSWLGKFIKFMSQHGRIIQPWGVQSVKWINRNKLSPLR
jgi:hypothetical protein